MLHRLLAIVLLCSFTVTITGCGSPRSDRPQVKKSIMDNWPEGTSFLSNEESGGFATVSGIASTENWKSVAAELKKPSFKESLDQFSASELPSGFDEKKDAKEKFVAKLNQLLEEANGGADKKKIKTLYTEATAAQKELVQ